MTSEDLTGIGKALDSEIAKRTYDEALSPALRSTGAFAGDVAEAFRLFTFPIQLAATVQNRLAQWLDQVRSRVPEERQQAAPAEIVGPMLLNLVFVDDESHLQKLFLQILQLSIDKQHVADIHPAFIKTVEQLSTDEAAILALIKCERLLGDYSPNAVVLGFETLETNLGKTQRLTIALERLSAMAVCESADWEFEDTWFDTRKVRGSSLQINLSKFGSLFVDCVVPSVS